MTITELLADATRRRPDATFLRTAEGQLTYAQVERRSASLAGGLRTVGCRRGEPVVVLMHNSLDQLVTWFALARLGAVHVPLNTALIGAGLAHALEVTGARVAVVDAELAGRLDDLPDPDPDPDVVRGMRLVIRCGDPSPAAPAHTPFEALAAADPVAPVTVDDLDTATVLFTSGSTGVSKGCALSHRYLARQGQLHAAHLELTADDVLYAPFPLFHIDAATLTVVAALTVGATAAVGRRFSASRFWDEARAFGATVFNFLGATLTILWKQPPTGRDRDHRVRLGWGVPMPDWQAGFERRFGVALYEVYGLTDAGVSAYQPLDGTSPAGSCGRVIEPYELVIAGADGRPVPPGTTGEITVRTSEAGLVMNEYWRMPDATTHAFRGGAFHTGDLGRLDRDGNLFFAGRADDAIRRRGENISPHEVEQVLLGHPEVAEAAAVGVRSELTEQDVKAFVVLHPGAPLTPERLHRFCRERLAAFMVPRYLEFVGELPKTPTEKIERFRLAGLPIGAATWDSERRAAQNS